MGGNFTNRTNVASHATRDGTREAKTRIPKPRPSAKRIAAAQARGRYARTKRLLDAGLTPQQVEAKLAEQSAKRAAFLNDLRTRKHDAELERKRAAQERLANARREHLEKHGPHGLDNQVPRGDRELNRDIELNTIELPEDFYGCGDPSQLAFDAFQRRFSFAHRIGTRQPGDEWTVWRVTHDYEPSGHIFWFGFSTNAPEEIIDQVHRELGAFMPCRRSKRRADEDRFSPMAWMGDEGIELLAFL